MQLAFAGIGQSVPDRCDSHDVGCVAIPEQGAVCFLVGFLDGFGFAGRSLRAIASPTGARLSQGTEGACQRTRYVARGRVRFRESWEIAANLSDQVAVHITWQVHRGDGILNNRHTVVWSPSSSRSTGNSQPYQDISAVLQFATGLEGSFYFEVCIFC